MIKQILKCKKGMTLVELMIGLAIFAVFSTSSVMILVPVLNTYSAARDLADASVLATNIGDVLLNEISLATEILTDLTTPQLEIEFKKLNGEAPKYKLSDESFLLKNGNLVFSKEYYSGTKVFLEFLQVGELIQIDIKISGNRSANENIICAKTMYARPIKK